MKIKKETKIKGLKTESIIAFMVLGVILIMTICSTFIGYNFKMETAKAETITNLSGTKWYFNETIQLQSTFNYNVNIKYEYFQEEEQASSINCIQIKYLTLRYYNIAVYDQTRWYNTQYRTIEIIDGEDTTNTELINWITTNATQVIPDYTPQLELVTITNQYVKSNTDYWSIKENVAIGIKLINAEEYTPVNDVIELNMDILWNGSNTDIENVYLSEKLKFTSWQNTNEYITILSIERNETSEKFTRILIYDEDSTQHYEIPKSGAQLSINALLQNTYYIRDLGADYYTIRYRQGYNDGMETDQTLLSVIWGTMQIPFNIIFGTYNNTTHTYDGGLFNFTILGINVRAFTLGLMSMAIILAIVKLILGNK